MDFSFVKITKAGHNRDMEPIRFPSEEEIRAAYRQGEDAVVKIFFETLGKLVERNQRLED